MSDQSNFPKGQIVLVYLDPISRRTVEGTAVLKEFKGNVSNNLEQWVVHFHEDSHNTDCNRFISKECAVVDGIVK